MAAARCFTSSFKFDWTSAFTFSVCETTKQQNWDDVLLENQNVPFFMEALLLTYGGSLSITSQWFISHHTARAINPLRKHRSDPEIEGTGGHIGKVPCKAL